MLSPRVVPRSRPEKPPVLAFGCRAACRAARARLLRVTVCALGLVGLLGRPVWAQTETSEEVQVQQVETFEGVITRTQTVITLLLVGLATLALMIAGGLYLWGTITGDPGKNEKAKIGVRSAAVGYGLAALAGAVVAVLSYIVGV